jgi:hypothetical protein
MRHLLLTLSIAFIISANAEAQNTNKIHFMMVSIHAGSTAHHPELIVTKDSVQDITKAGTNSWMYKGITFDTRDGKIESNEDSLFKTLKPYFDAGWQLAGSTIIKNNNIGIDDYIARYYFTKKDD